MDSPFEESVKRAIEKEGYEVHPQVGTAGFFIDLAVVDPKQPSRYVLGIECDGASYHSARSARERDRQREAVLRNHGWEIHRIWSTDWFVQPQAQLQRVLEAIENAISNSGAATKPKMAKEAAPLARLERAEPEAAHESSAEPYQEATYDLETDLDIHEVSTQWMTELVLFIAGVEAPIHTKEVITRIREFWGVGRAGSRIQEKIRKAADLLTESGKIHQDGEFLLMPDQEITVRDRSSAQSTSLMKTEMLPPMEIQAAIMHIIKANHGVSEEEIAVGVGRMLGFRSTSQQLKTIVTQEVQSLLTSDRIIEHAGFLKLTENA
jgi:very-short-patch-repair endonuclease